MVRIADVSDLGSRGMFGSYGFGSRVYWDDKTRGG